MRYPPFMVVLSQALYGELGVMSNNVVAPQPQDNGVSNGDCNGNNQMHADYHDAHGDKDKRSP